MKAIKPFFLAARPKTLPAVVSPVILAGYLAWYMHQFRFWPLFAALAGALLIQIATNYANDYFDFIKGTDTKERIGPTRATASGQVKPSDMKWAFIIAFGLAAIPGAYLVYEAGWVIVVIGIASVLSGIAYTGGPYPLGYHGWGDLFVLIFFGPVAVVGSFYVSALEWNSYVFTISFAPGFISVAILCVNNFRDMVTDQKTGKNTLAVRFGSSFARLEYLLSLTIAAVIPSIAFFIDHINWMGALSVFFLFFTVKPIRQVFDFIPEKNNVDMNATLAGTGKLQIFFALTFILVSSIPFFIVWLKGLSNA